MLIPIAKIDEEKRLVIGRATQEVPDRSGEIMDYESAKPEFEKWSAEQFEASGGKSKGNLRAMHGAQVAGVLHDIAFDDTAKAVDVVAHVVDDGEWKKVLSGAYTGFSIGGKYIKRWKDGDYTRYTPSIAELSLVDRPCVPSAQFADIVKADGSIGKLALGVEMTDTPEQLELEPVEKADEHAAAQEAEAVTIEADPAPVVDAKKSEALAELAKGAEVRDVGMAVSILSAIEYLISCEKEEAEEGMPEPAEQVAALRAAVASIKAFIVSEIQEDHESVEDEGEGGDMEMAEGTEGLEKRGASISAMNKTELNAMMTAAEDIGKRCKKMLDMGEDMDGKADGDELAKAADILSKVEAERDELRKSVDSLTAERDALSVQKAEWEAAPAPAKGIAKAVAKEQDIADKSDPVADLEKRIAGMSNEDKAKEIFKFQMQHGAMSFRV